MSWYSSSPLFPTSRMLIIFASQHEHQMQFFFKTSSLWSVVKKDHCLEKIKRLRLLKPPLRFRRRSNYVTIENFRFAARDNEIKNPKSLFWPTHPVVTTRLQLFLNACERSALLLFLERSSSYFLYRPRFFVLFCYSLKTFLLVGSAVLCLLIPRSSFFVFLLICYFLKLLRILLFRLISRPPVRQPTPSSSNITFKVH